jgi:hypothetical protein
LQPNRCNGLKTPSRTMVCLKMCIVNLNSCSVYLFRLGRCCFFLCVCMSNHFCCFHMWFSVHAVVRRYVLNAQSQNPALYSVNFWLK